MDYDIRQYLANTHNYGVGRAGYGVKYIVIHYTATDASAYLNCKNNANNRNGYSAHYYVDNTGIWQSVRDRDTSWAAGNLNINNRCINIEVISSDGTFTGTEIQYLRFLVPMLMRRHDVSKDRIIRHYDVASVAKIGRVVDPYKKCPRGYIDTAKWNNLVHNILEGGDLEYSQVAQDGWIGYESIIALQKIFNIYENGLFWGQPIGWRQYHLRIPDTAIRYENNPKRMDGSEVVMNMQRLCGYDRSGYLSKGFIKTWQGFVSDSIAQDGYFGDDTAKATQRWINYQLKKNKIKL